MRNWSEICQKCADGEIEPTFCQYYGDPKGCNSPTYQEHPQVYNAAAMRDALEDVLGRVDEYSQLFDICDAALAAPARNCDTTKDAAEEAYKREFGRPWNTVEDELAAWLFANAEGGGHE